MEIRDLYRGVDTLCKAFMDEMHMRVLIKFVFRDIFSGRAWRISKIEIEEITDADLIVPTYGDFALDQDAAQKLMDALWGLGIRPSGAGSEGQLAAVQHHLTDMRQINFRLIEHILSKE
jgi:hypothetical protein